MASPAVSLKSRELTGSDAPGQRDSASLPTPTCLTPTEYESIARKVPSLRRGGAYSSMRETRREQIRQELGFRERKISGNFTSDLNESDIDYRHSMTERTRRISMLRAEFLKSTLQQPDPFRRSGTRASMPASSFKVRDFNVYKFPFVEPTGTPPPSRRIIVDGSTETDGEIKETRHPEKAVLPTSESKPKDPKELYRELMKRYSPPAKPVDMKLPPTKPKVVATVNKQASVEDDLALKNGEGKISDEQTKSKERKETDETGDNVENHQKNVAGQQSSSVVKENGNGKESSDESSERHDRVPEMANISKPGPVLKNNNIAVDDSIPTLLEKISKDPPANAESNGKKKSKRKRSFLDKLLNRNKNK